MSSTLIGAEPAVVLAAGQSLGQAVTFWFCAVISVGAALGMVLSRKAVHCALLLAGVMLCLAALYAAQDAPFLAFVQVIVYTGAVMMLFLFVLMLVGVDSSDSLVETIRGQRLWAGIAALGFGLMVVVGLGTAVTSTAVGLAGANSEGNVLGLARLLFTRYVFAFELTSALLITAALGAMVLAHRERLRPRVTQQELSVQRFHGPHPTPLPGPGVYARHNAVDVPALLPDGKPSTLSVSPVIARQREDATGVPEDERQRAALPSVERERAYVPPTERSAVPPVEQRGDERVDVDVPRGTRAGREASEETSATRDVEQRGDERPDQSEEKGGST